MRGVTKVAMGATLAVALTLVLVLVLLLVLLAELCCSHLRQRSHHSRRLQTLLPTTMNSIGSSSPKPRKQQSNGGEAATEGDGPTTTREKPLCPNTSAYYSQGVLQVPASFLFAIPNREASTASNKQNESCESQSGGKNSLHFIGLISTTPSPPPVGGRGDAVGSGSGSQRFVCISNPMFDGVGRGNGVGDDGGGGGGGIDSTPFETPDTSPSRLEIEEEDESDSSPPMTLMKKLPPSIPSSSGASATVCLMDGRRSLATWVNATDSYRPSSSSSNSLCSSPSW